MISLCIPSMEDTYKNVGQHAHVHDGLRFRASCIKYSKIMNDMTIHYNKHLPSLSLFKIDYRLFINYVEGVDNPHKETHQKHTRCTSVVSIAESDPELVIYNIIWR